MSWAGPVLGCSCGTGRGAGSADAIYTFVAPTTDRWVFRLDTDYDAALYLVEDCADIANSCVGAQRAVGKGEALHVDLDAGQAVYVVVDGAYNNSDLSGRYTLRADPCVPDCEDKACGSDGCGGSCGDRRRGADTCRVCGTPATEEELYHVDTMWQLRREGGCHVAGTNVGCQVCDDVSEISI